MPILTSADYPEIRSVIDLTMDAADLPDSVIAMDVFQGWAERKILVRDPDALTRMGDEAAAVRLAAIFFTAARIVPAIPRLMSESVMSSKYTLKPWDISEKVAELIQAAEDALDDYLPADPNPAGTHFVTVAGCRGA